MGVMTSVVSVEASFHLIRAAEISDLRGLSWVYFHSFCLRNKTRISTSHPA